jgi:hypothetical protein
MDKFEYPVRMFEPTIAAVLNSLVALDVPQEDVEADAMHIEALMVTCKESILTDSDPRILYNVMDLAFIGVIYHRHMPFIDADTGERFVPSEKTTPRSYSATAKGLGSALVTQEGIRPGHVDLAMMQGALLARTIIRDEKDRNPEDEQLLQDLMSACGLGMIVHLLLPTTSESPVQ